MGKDKSRRDKGKELVPPPRWAGEAELHALARSVGAAALIADATGALLFASEPFEALAEALGAPLSGVGWLEVLSPEDRARARELWIAAAEAREPREATLALAGGAGPRVWRITPVLEEDRVTRWVVALAPETPDPVLRVQADRMAGLEVALREAEARLSRGEAQLRAAEDARALAQAAARRLGEELAAAQVHLAERAAAAEHAAVRLRAFVAEAEGRLAQEAGGRAAAERRALEAEGRLAEALAMHRAEAEDARRREDRGRHEAEAALAQARRLAEEALARAEEAEGRARSEAMARGEAVARLLAAEERAAEARSDLAAAERRADAAERQLSALAERLRLAEGEQAHPAEPPQEDPVLPSAAEADAPAPPAAPGATALEPDLHATQVAQEAGPAASLAPSDGAPQPDDRHVVVMSAPSGTDPTGSEAGSQDDAALDRLADRLRSGDLRAMLGRWRAARRDGPVPRFDDSWQVDGASPALQAVLVELGPDGAPSRREGTTDGEASEPGPVRWPHAADDLASGPLAAGWRRCARMCRPVHEFAELRLGGAGLGFERLLLPFASDARTTNLLLGLTVRGPLGPPPGGDAGPVP